MVAGEAKSDREHLAARTTTSKGSRSRDNRQWADPRGGKLYRMLEVWELTTSSSELWAGGSRGGRAVDCSADREFWDAASSSGGGGDDKASASEGDSDFAAARAAAAS